MNNLFQNIIFRHAASPESVEARWNGFKPQQRVLKSGFKVSPDSRPLTCDILLERDHPIVLRDGTTIFCDVYRPVTDDLVPAILAVGVYGKQGGFFHPGTYPGNSGIKPGVVSGLQKFEGPDPAFWCAHGYAVVNLDARGTFASHGDAHFLGPQEAEDNYDVIESLALESWCSGKVGMAGNGWLAVAQWMVAELKPPHLAAIAPWEGFTDAYQDMICRGGIPSPEFAETIVSCIFGRGQVEDLPAMLSEHPFDDEYWANKRVDPKKIDVPAYIVSSYTTTLHVRGGPSLFKHLNPRHTWLRFHNTHEWPDFYEYESDLLKYFDFTLKGRGNGWDKTPRVRVSILDPGHSDTVNRPGYDWPLPDTVPTRFNLEASTGQLLADAPPQMASVKYDAASGFCTFSHTFNQDFQFVGPSKLHIWMSADQASDFDVYVFIQKVNADGEVVLSESLPGVYVPLATGKLRASRRELDLDASTALEPVQKHKSNQFLEPASPVPLEIGLWPAGMRFHEGESLQLVISGHDRRVRYLNQDSTPGLFNGGNSVLTGGEYDSYLLLPVLPRT